MSGETPLPGRTTPGVVRVGATIRRPPSPNSEFVQALLRGLHAAGFQAAPLALGRDEQGRDVLSFVEGEAPSELQDYDDAVLAAAAALIRRYHDATARFLNGAVGALGLEVVCHNDLSPCNFVFRDGRPAGLIDFDVAAPGSRLFDLGYAAWMWLQIGSDLYGPREQGRRLRVFAAGYGGHELAPIVEAVVLRQTIVAAEGRRYGKPEMSDWAAGCEAWVRLHRTSLACDG